MYSCIRTLYLIVNYYKRVTNFSDFVITAKFCQHYNVRVIGEFGAYPPKAPKLLPVYNSNIN